MGADIHVFIETRVGDGEWVADRHHVIEDEGDDCRFLKEVTATGRHYDLFARLAGVRGHGPEAKGLPEDVSPLIKEGAELWGEDGHSHSWETPESFKKIITKLGYYKIDETMDIQRWEEHMSSTDAFFHWDKYEYGERPPSYITMINYCEKLIEEHRVEQALLNFTKDDLQVRIVFWFDN